MSQCGLKLNYPRFLIAFQLRPAVVEFFCAMIDRAYCAVAKYPTPQSYTVLVIAIASNQASSGRLLAAVCHRLLCCAPRSLATKPGIRL